MRRVGVRVTGRVQGVGFRWATQRRALELDLTGWVRNREDGGVEIEAEGDDAAIAELLAWLRVGPRFSEVADLHYEDQVPQGESTFEVRY